MAERRSIESVVLCCGGTGGHVYPAIAIAREILARNPSARVSFIGRADSYEERTLAREGFASVGPEADKRRAEVDAWLAAR